MSTPIRPLPPTLKKKLLIRYVGGGAIFIALLWANYILKAAFNINLLGHVYSTAPTPAAADSTFELGMALVGSVLIAIALVYYWKRTTHMAMCGVETLGTIEKVGVLGQAGQVPATVVYVHNGQEFKTRIDILRDEAEVGGTIALLVDPDKPKSVILRSSVPSM